MRIPKLTRFLFLFLPFLSVFTLAQSETLEGWDFLADPSGKITVDQLKSATGWRAARAGVSLNAQFDDLRDFGGYAWYRTSIEVPEFAEPRHVLIRFGAVDYSATVYVNGVSVGEHTGGYTPFQFDITKQLHRGANEVAVRIYDVPPGDKRYKQIPHGKQSWYIQTSGLWQPVTLEYKPATYIDSVRVTPSNEGQVQIEVALAGAPATGGVVQVQIRDRQGREVATQKVPVASDLRSEIATQVQNPELWSPDHPALYTAQVQFEAPAGKFSNSSTVRFGFRHLETRDGKLLLNGKPFYMMGALDQDFYPDTVYTPPSHEYVRREMELAKSLGLNTLRCHIKVCEPEYLDAADEVGILVWYEIPNWDQLTPDSERAGEQIFDEMVARDWNHPSIGIQSLINESWGIDLRSAEQRQWLAQFVPRAQQAVAPLGRLIVDNSACCENFHVRTDLDDFHQYYSIPDNASKWDAWVADFASRPKWSFSQYGDAQRTGKEPLIVSEFGNWGLPLLPQKLPWWFSRSNQEITRPAGVYERFQGFKFGRIFHTYDELARATQRHQFLSLQHEIEQMRRFASVQGYVITEFTDLNWESNGLLTMWREPKVYAQELHDVQQPDVVLATFDHRNVKAGELVDARILVSHFSDRDLRDARVLWWTDTGQSASEHIGQVPGPQSVLDLGKISFSALVPGGSGLTDGSAGLTEVHLYLQLRDAQDALVAQNRYTINVFLPGARSSAKIAVYDPASALSQLRNELSASGYNVVESATVMVASRWDDRVSRFVVNGGTAIVLANSSDALPATLPLKLKERKDEYDGNWVSNFAWIDPYSPVFQSITADPILGWEAATVMPHFVLRGVKPEQYDDVLAGMFYGWINLNSPLLVQARVGKGVALVTTFHFEEYEKDPYSKALLDSMIRYIQSDACRPTLEWTP